MSPFSVQARSNLQPRKLKKSTLLLPLVSCAGRMPLTAARTAPVALPPLDPERDSDPGSPGSPGSPGCTAIISTPSAPSKLPGVDPVTKINAEALQRAREHIALYASPLDGRSCWVVGVTFALWLAALEVGIWWWKRADLSTTWGLALSACWIVFRIGTYVRAFVLMHDATHNALFTKRWANYWTGIISGLMVGMDAPGERLKLCGAAAAVVGQQTISRRSSWVSGRQLLWHGSRCGGAADLSAGLGQTFSRGVVNPAAVLVVQEKGGSRSSG